MEALGVFALNYIGGMCLLANNIAASSLVAGALPAFNAAQAAGALAHTLALGIFIWIGAATSGANYNPAVTIALLLTKNLGPINACLYILAQIAGSFLGGAMVYLGAYSNTNHQYASSYPSIGVGVDETVGGNWWKALLVEFIATFFLVFVVFATAVDKRASPSSFGMAIGATVAMSAYGIGGISGAALNPCRWLGPAVINYTSNQFWWGLLVYNLGPISGGLCAGALYNFALLE